LWNTEWCHLISHNRCDHWWQNCSFFRTRFLTTFFSFILLCVMIQKNVEMDEKKCTKHKKKFSSPSMEPKWIFTSSSSSLLNFQQEIYNLESQVLLLFLLLSVVSISFLCGTAFFLSLISFTLLHHFGYISYVAASKEFNILITFFLLLDVAHIFLWTMHSFIYFGRLTDWLAGWLNILNFCYEKIRFRFPFFTQKGL
jgi:membrane-associated HD superfamily phosphohydrolase